MKNAVPVKYQKFSIHPLKDGKEYTMLKHEQMSKNAQYDSVGVVFTEAVIKKNGFGIFAGTRFAKLNRPQYSFKEKTGFEDVGLGFIDTNTSTLMISIYVGHADTKFDLHLPPFVSKFEFRSSHYNIVVLRSLIALPAIIFSDTFFSQTFNPEDFGPEHHAALRNLMAGKTPEICLQAHCQFLELLRDKQLVHMTKPSPYDIYN